MNFRHLLPLAFLSCAIVGAQAQSIAILLQPIPPGFDFPAKRSIVQGWADARDVVAARSHAWRLWEGMTQPSAYADPSDSDKFLPIWETWFSQTEIFPPVASSVDQQRALRPVTVPNQLLHAATNGPTQILSFNKFNPAAGSFIVGPHIGPKSTQYRYNSPTALSTSLGGLNAAWPTGTPLQLRVIDDFPLRAIETKPVFMLVKAKGFTAIPYWLGPAVSANPVEPTPDTWLTCVLFDPLSTDTLRPATAAQSAAAKKPGSGIIAPGLKCENFLYSGLSQIYAYRLTAEGAAALNSNAEAGDYAVLVAMHVNTKEIINWTWQTFFWTGRQNPPNGFPGSIYNQPESLKSPWNNYAMCTAYWQAAIEIGPDRFDPAYFTGNTRTDFSWAVARAK